MPMSSCTIAAWRPAVDAIRVADTSARSQFICYNIEFATPARELWQLGVRDSAFSSAWSNEPPLLLTATMLQQGWCVCFTGSVWFHLLHVH